MCFSIYSRIHRCIRSETQVGRGAGSGAGGERGGGGEKNYGNNAMPYIRHSRILVARLLPLVLLLSLMV